MSLRYQQTMTFKPHNILIIFLACIEFAGCVEASIALFGVLDMTNEPVLLDVEEPNLFKSIAVFLNQASKESIQIMLNFDSSRNSRDIAKEQAFSIRIVVSHESIQAMELARRNYGTCFIPFELSGLINGGSHLQMWNLPGSARVLLFNTEQQSITAMLSTGVSIKISLLQSGLYNCSQSVQAVNLESIILVRPDHFLVNQSSLITVHTDSDTDELLRVLNELARVPRAHQNILNKLHSLMAKNPCPYSCFVHLTESGPRTKLSNHEFTCRPLGINRNQSCSLMFSNVRVLKNVELLKNRRVVIGKLNYKTNPLKLRCDADESWLSQSYAFSASELNARRWDFQDETGSWNQFSLNYEIVAKPGIYRCVSTLYQSALVEYLVINSTKDYVLEESFSGVERSELHGIYFHLAWTEVTILVARFRLPTRKLSMQLDAAKPLIDSQDCGRNNALQAKDIMTVEPSYDESHFEFISRVIFTADAAQKVSTISLQCKVFLQLALRFRNDYSEVTILSSEVELVV